MAESTRGELGQPLGFWSWGYRVHCIPSVEEIVAPYEEVPAASGVIGTEGNPGILISGAGLDVQRMHQVADAVWSKWVLLVTLGAQIGNLSHCDYLQDFQSWDWQQGRDCWIPPEEDVTWAEETLLHNKLPKMRNNMLCLMIPAVL